MKHEMRITVAKRDETPISVAEFRNLSFAERALGKWFGKSQKVMVIVPEDNVKKIEIKEV